MRGQDLADSRIRLKSGMGSALFTATIVAPLTDLQSAPGRDRTPETQLAHGWHFRVHDRDADWAYGLALNPLDPARPDYAGWVREAHMVERCITPTHRVTVLRTPVFSRPDIKSPIRQFLPLAARVTERGGAVGNGGGFLQLGGGGFVTCRHVSPLDREWAHEPADIAETFQGLPYVWGGNGPDGMDCSGLVKLSIEATGLPCPRDADQQEAALGEPFRPDSALMNLRRGDLVFWPGHVGIMQTSGRLLHANAHHMQVATEPLREAVERIGAIRTARRLTIPKQSL